MIDEFPREILGAQKTTISVLELLALIENGTIFRIFEVSIPFRDEFPEKI